MRFLPLIVLLFALPAGAFTDSESKCTSPESGVTCIGSEPLDKDDGAQDGCGDAVHNPTGSTLNEMNGGNAMTALNGCEAGGEWVSDAQLTSNPLTTALPGADYVFKAIKEDHNWRVVDVTVTFTNNTYCTRWYTMLEGGNTWHCDGQDCNQKLMRFTKTGINHPGFEADNRFSAGVNGYVNYNLCIFEGAQDTGGCGVIGPKETYDPPTICRRCAEPGCDCGSGTLRRNLAGTAPADFSNIKTDAYEGNWIRREICFDHNPSAGVPETGNNYIWARVRETLVTGPNAGDIQYYGPGRGVNGLSFVNTGSHTRLWTAGHGNPNNGDQTEGDQFVAFFMTATKSPADPTWWIGPANEITADSGAPVIQSPTETEGVNFGSGINISSIFPWYNSGIWATLPAGTP